MNVDSFCLFIVSPSPASAADCMMFFVPVIQDKYIWTAVHITHTVVSNEQQ